MRDDLRAKIISAWSDNSPLSLVTPHGLRIEISEALPVFGFALHSGNKIREALEPKLNLSRKQMLKEEDPKTEELIASLPNRIYPLFSRFECDLNRPKVGRPVDDAVYTEPSLAWDLRVYRDPLTQQEIDTSLEAYREFYWIIEGLCHRIEQKYGYGLLIDMHSYNTRGREGLPDVHLGTKYQSQEKFSEEISHLTNNLKDIEIQGKPLVVKEKDERVGFYGGKLNRWVAQEFSHILVVSLEMKKFYMDEDQGLFYEDVFSEFKDKIQHALSLMVDDVWERLKST